MIQCNTTPDTTLEHEVKDLIERLTVAGAVKDAALIQNLATMAKKNTLTTPFGEIFIEKSIDDIYHNLYISILTPQGYNETIACIDYNDEEKTIDTYAYRGNEEEWVSKVRNWDKDIQKEADELIAEVQNQIEICTDVVANHIAE